MREFCFEDVVKSQSATPTFTADKKNSENCPEKEMMLQFCIFFFLHSTRMKLF